MSMNYIKTSLDTINKAQIGKYAYQGIFTPSVEPVMEFNIVSSTFALRTFIGSRHLKPLVFIGSLRSEIQKSGETPSVIHYRNVEFYEKAPLQNRKNFPRVKHDFMDLVEEIQDIWGKIPEEELNKIPKDASEKLDAYLYGKPE